MDKELNLFDDKNGQKSGFNAIKFKITGNLSYEKWNELFDGYDRLKIITYSSSLYMIKNIIKSFNDVEIIFGNENVLGSLETLITEQYATMKMLQDVNYKDDNVFIDRIKAGTLSFYVTNLENYTSHQKLYLLSGDGGKFRTITGSANFSLKAFNSNQIENILVSDDEDTYAVFEEIYNQTKKYSTQEITEKSIKKLDIENIEELPAFKEVLQVKELQMEEPEEGIQRYRVEEGDFKKFLQDNNINLNKDLIKKKGKKILITHDKVKKVVKNFTLALDEKRKTYVHYPVFYLKKSDGQIYLNDKVIDLNVISEQDILKDIAIFKEFFAGYFDPELKFRGDLLNNVRKYYATVNYCFCAPFLSVCRNETIGTNVEVTPYPMFLLLKGITNAGKSMLMKFMLKLCFNNYGLNIDNVDGLLQKADTADNAPAKLQEKIALMKGMPLMIDEVSPTRWKGYGERFIKSDMILGENLSPVIMASNDIKEIDEALGKRTISFDIDITIPRISNLQRKDAVKNLNNFTGALYKIYLKEMLVVLPAFLKTFHEEKKKEYPDLLGLSSKVLYDIFKKYNLDEELPDYIDIYDIQYYLIKANDHEKINDFRDLYEKVGDEWEVNRKLDTIKIKFENQYQARDFQRKYGMEFADWQGRNIIMPLRKVERFFGLKIGKKSFVDKLKFWCND